MIEAGIVLLCSLGWIVALCRCDWQAKTSHDTGRQSIHEAFLVGLCMLRSGVLESTIYDATLAHVEHQQQGTLSHP
jgi:hypothetical protein